MATKERNQEAAAAEAQGPGTYPVRVRVTDDGNPPASATADFTITVNDVYVSAGAGFLVAITGDIATMPGFPRKPNAEGVDVAPDGRITGLF